MNDKLGHKIHRHSKVIIPLRVGIKHSSLGTGVVFDSDPIKRRVAVELDGGRKSSVYWFRTVDVVVVTEDMDLEEKRKRLRNVQEGVQVS